MESTQGRDHVTGTREELIAELEERATAWHHMASDRKRDRAREAAQGLRDGSFSVRVGNTCYSVVDKPVNAVQGDDVPEPRTACDETADEAVSQE